jgi:multidrug efflux system membrane fusion protein
VVPTGFLALLLAVAIAPACSRPPAAEKQTRAAVVRAVRVVERDVPIETRAVGRVVSSQSVVIKPEVSGRIVAVHFTEGQNVKAGQLLLEIDPRPYRAALAVAEARLAQDRARARNARADAERYQKLLEKSFVAEQQHATAQAEAAALEAGVAGDQAEVERAEVDLARCAIRAPAPGRTGRLLVHAGNTVSSSDAQPLLTIERRRPAYAEFSIQERYLAALRTGEGDASPATVRTDGGVERKGTLDLVENAVDAATGSVLVRAKLANEDEALWPGQVVEVRLQLELRKAARVVPASAIAQGQQGDYAYVVTRQATAEMRPVVVEPAGDDEFVVLKGLSPGELVVTDGQIKLTPGARVELLDEKDGK